VQTQQQTESKLRAQTQTQAKETYPFPSDKAMQNIKQACKVEDHISLIKFIHQFGYRVTISEPYGKSLDQTFSVQLPTGKRTSIKGKFSFISFVKREILSSK
jgi:maltose-binding protein MalE